MTAPRARQGDLRVDRETLADLIGEGVHAGLRKAAESPESSTAWRAISQMPDWSDVIEFVVWGLEQSGAITWKKPG